MRFLEAVRSDKIPAPTRKNFSRQQWHADATRLCEDARDTNLKTVGEWLYDRLEAIRQALTFVNAPDPSETTKLRALVAFANQNMIALHHKVSDAVASGPAPGATVPMDEFIGLKIELPVGAHYRPDEIVQSIVDGVQIPIRVVLNGRAPDSGNPQWNGVNWRDIRSDANLGVLYGWLEGLWDDALWNGYVLSESEPFVLSSCEESNIDWKIVSQYRKDSLDSQFFMLASASFDTLSLEKKRALVGVRSVLGSTREGRRTKYLLTNQVEVTEHARNIALMQLYAQEPYYQLLIDEASRTAPGLNLRQLLGCWHVVSDIAELHWSKLDSPSSVDKPLSEFVNPIQHGSLCDVVSRATGVSLDRARLLVDFLTYRGEPAQELWAQPLVHIAPGKLAPLFGATKSPNLRRIVDVWLAQLGIDLSARGPAFESSVRNEIAAAIAASPKLSGAKVIDGTFVFRPRGGREEELDIVVGLGTLVLVGEVKCILHPTEPKQYFRHRQTVMDAIQQVKRKAKSILENPKDFIEQVGRRELSVNEEFDVLPIVILDGAIHAGVARDGVPIVDPTILRIFFDGELPMFVTLGARGSTTVGQRQQLYSDWTTAIATARTYFEHPPQLKHIWDGLRERRVPLPPIPGSGLPGATFITKEVSSQAAQGKITDEQAL